MQAVNIHKRFIMCPLGSVRAWTLNGLGLTRFTARTVGRPGDCDSGSRWPPSSLRTTRRLILVGVEQPFKWNRAFGQPWRFTSKIQEGSVRHSDLSFRAALIIQSAL